jgi:hypothetical protein
MNNEEGRCQLKKNDMLNIPRIKRRRSGAEAARVQQ